jgi:hypothetical protein
VSPVKYELGFYIAEDDILQLIHQLRDTCIQRIDNSGIFEKYF